ncbi:acyltransferase family protein [Streptacidiphilus melanogenes]|uniref:acyltransferase family protein n=1 Tax=Streptacidiphilus melanogenes TaxID=411235 RepID=UPI0006943EBB|nr:acyltransferase [Streptacidiphilus melanogenes]
MTDGVRLGRAASAAAVRTHPVPAPSPAAAPRLGWLDALRGAAALCVVFQHVGPWLLPGPFRVEHQRLDLGMFGVFLFFLISGYIVPASLERRGDLRAFWVGRLFRLHPPFVVVTFLGALLPAAHAAVAAHVYRQWPTGVGNALMLSDLLGVDGALRVAWTLSYEMVFYYLVTALFAFGRHRSSGPVALGLAAVGVFAGSALPHRLLSGGAVGEAPVVAATALAAVLALACILTGSRVATRTGAAVLGALALTLVVLNGRTAGFESMSILATMFAGATVHRAEHAQIGRRQAVLCCGLAFVGCLVAGEEQGGRSLNLLWTASAGSWCAGFAGAWAVFLLGWLLRGRPMPRPLRGLGTISYSVYLLHVPLLNSLLWLFAVVRLRPEGLREQVLCCGAFLVVLVALASLTHRWVELPAQRLGRRLVPRSPLDFSAPHPSAGPAATNTRERVH